MQFENIDSLCCCPKEDQSENQEQFTYVPEENAISPYGDLGQFVSKIEECIEKPADSLKYITNKVIISFIIDRDGSLITPKIIRCDNPHLAKEAMLCLFNSPKWISAKNKGKNVRQMLVIPIRYFRKK
jgi:protein TonB